MSRYNEYLWFVYGVYREKPESHTLTRQEILCRMYFCTSQQKVDTFSSFLYSH